MSRKEYLTEKQWEAIEPYLPKLESRGRPRREDRECLEGIVWVLRSGARWQDMPEQYPSAATCWRRLKQWTEQDVWLDIWRALIGKLNARRRVDFEETFIDGSFAAAKKGAAPSAKRSEEKAQNLWLWQTARVFLWASPFTRPAPRKSPSPKRRSKSGEKITRRSPKRLIADRAYDSDPFRKRLARRRIEQITPHRRNRVKVPLQDGRALRRYRRRWKIERTISWLGSFRRVHTRWDRSLLMYTGFVHLACVLIVCRYL